MIYVMLHVSDVEVDMFMSKATDSKATGMEYGRFSEGSGGLSHITLDASDDRKQYGDDAIIA